jgi:diacylglycerol kinase (ATP)
MRVALIHNVTAGDRVYNAEDLTSLFRDAGHEMAHFGRSQREIWRAIATTPDVLVIAGGDGSVAKAAIALRDHDSTIPLFILPLGTSNNIARSLGVRGTIPVLVQALGSARQIRLDIGSASADWGEQSFVEAAGVGFMGAILRHEHSLRSRWDRFLSSLRASARGNSSEVFVQRAARGIARRILRQPVRYHDVRGDGEDLSGEYLTVEVMNIRALGPRIVLAPDAEAGDGLLELVFVRAADRGELADYVASVGARRVPPIMSRRVRRAEISWQADDGHIDDEPWPRSSQTATGRQRVRVSLRGAVSTLIADVPSAAVNDR